MRLFCDDIPWYRTHISIVVCDSDDDACPYGRNVLTNVTMKTENCFAIHATPQKAFGWRGFAAKTAYIKSGKLFCGRYQCCHSTRIMMWMLTAKTALIYIGKIQVFRKQIIFCPYKTVFNQQIDILTTNETHIDVDPIWIAKKKLSS